MRRSWRMLIPMAVLVACACAPPSEAPDEAETTLAGESGPDPVVVDPDHYGVELENARVRVLRIHYGPGEQSVMHFHPDSVAVFLTAANVRFELPDGESKEVQAAAGEEMFAPAGQHRPTNLGDAPLDVVQVELKGAPSATPGAGGTDPTNVDPAHYKTEFENDVVRVVRITYGPGEESIMHYHPDSVAVFLTDQHAQFDDPDGATREERAAAGDVVYVEAGYHFPRNLEPEPFELVLVELK